QYAAPFLFKKILSKEVYEHLLLFTSSCRLLSQKDPELMPVSVQKNLEILRKRKIEILKILYNGMILSINHPNNTVLLRNGSVAEIVELHDTRNSIEVTYKMYMQKLHVTSDSNTSDIWEVKKLSLNSFVASIEEVSKKLIAFKMHFSTIEEQRIFVVSFLH
ncbi:hypothetical protein TSAR_006601, partial [Trichomalopsis sarcophagae]